MSTKTMRLICYLSNGYPTAHQAIELANQYFAGGADVIEVDIPARNPHLEGDFIRGRMLEALRLEPSYDVHLQSLAKMRANHQDKQFILLVYEHTIKEIGVQRFLTFLQDNRFSDIIYNECLHPEIRDTLIQHGINVATYIKRTLDQEDITTAKRMNGFIYLQAKGDAHPQYPTLASARKYLIETEDFKRRIYAGVGIATPDDVAMVKEAGCDGVFVGSAILKLYDDPKSLKQTIHLLKQST